MKVYAVIWHDGEEYSCFSMVHGIFATLKDALYEIDAEGFAIDMDKEYTDECATTTVFKPFIDESALERYDAYMKADLDEPIEDYLDEAEFRLIDDDSYYTIEIYTVQGE